MRVKFNRGKQREFIALVLKKIMAPSLRKLEQYGININYQTLKSYYNENRTLPESLFSDLCRLAEINPDSVKKENIEDNWGKVKGGKN